MPGCREGAALALLACTVACGPVEPVTPAPHVVLITLESLRTDVIGVYGGASPTRPDRPVTPVLDAFAKTATLYSDAHAVTSWTLASHASLFTGLYPQAHQTRGPRDRLGDAYPTLAETLAAAGWYTAGVVSGPYLRRRHNLQQGFEQWSDEIASPVNPVAHDDVTNPRMLEALAATLDARDSARPLFLFAYFWDPHFDYLPPPPYDRMFVRPGSEPIDVSSFDTNPAIHPYMKRARLDWLLSQYAGDVRWTDAALGQLFELLRDRGLWDDALVIVTADHGEEFFDHGEKGHKKNLYAETVRVPLLIKYPGQREGRRDSRLVSLVDILPTVLVAAGVAPEFPLQGQPLQAPPAPERTIHFDLLSTWYAAGGPQAGAREQRWVAVRDATHKWVSSTGGGAPGREELYDVVSDPDERSDRASAAPARVSHLRDSHQANAAASLAIAAEYEAGGEASLDPAEIEQLCELGYLDC
jgi:arylsulfatase A-like enzyme